MSCKLLVKCCLGARECTTVATLAEVCTQTNSKKTQHPEFEVELVLLCCCQLVFVGHLLLALDHTSPVSEIF